MNIHRRGWAILVLSWVLLAGCQHARPQSNTVYFGPTAVYHLPAGSREVAPTKEATAFYERRFNFHPRFNQPLHRIVAGQGPETIYLGLVMPPVPGDLHVFITPDSVWQVVQQRELPGKAQLALLRGLRANEFNVRYVGVAKSGNTHVVNLLTQDSTVAKGYYNASKLFKGNLLL